VADPKMRNEPNLPPQPPGPRQICRSEVDISPWRTKRTQSTARPNTQIRETNPIPPSQQPIAKGQQLFLRNEPNFTPRHLFYFPLSPFAYLAGKARAHKPLPGKHLGESATQDCTGYTEALI
jgi:hypothetical protein